MRPARILSSLFLFFVLIATFVGLEQPARAQDNGGATSLLVIAHVPLINPATSSVEHDATVIVEGDRIASVLIGAMVKMPANTRLIDGRGKFLIPGLWDMHVHTAF